MLIASSCDGKSWAETHMSSANNINRLYQQNYLLQSRSFFKYQQLTKTGLYLKYSPALRLQSQHNLSPRSVLVILSTKAAIKPQSISNPQVTLLYDILLTTSLIIINSSFRNTALRASTNGKKKQRQKCMLTLMLLSLWFPLMFWRKTSLKMKEWGRHTEGKAHILKEPEGTR